MTARMIRFRGPIAALPPDDVATLLERRTASDDSIHRRTREIVARVRTGGDTMLRALALEFDGVVLGSLEVPARALHDALDSADAPFRRALERAARNITAAHCAFAPAQVEVETEPGIVVGRRPDPLTRAGVYAPGGSAAYASSVLMGAIPARVSGVGEIILCSPPSADGLPSAAIRAAAAVAGVDRVFALGGAGAIAAMAFGTESVPRVDRIVGPGNAYVAEAKQQLCGMVGIDAPAGPSELLVIADESASPQLIAREMIAQAEHDERACVVAVLVNQPVEPVLSALAAAAATTPRRDIVARALATHGALLDARDLDEALDFGARYAPEHLLLAVADPEALLPMVRNAGTVFLGAAASVAFGDYATGANHVLPTGGRARSYSGLTTSDFLRWTTYQRVTPAAARALACDVEVLAQAEGLPAHAAAARAWSAGGCADIPSRAARHIGRGQYSVIPRYTPDRSPCHVDLSDNTNLWGVPPAAARALRDSTSAACSRYPTSYADELKQAIADYIGVPPECIVTGCGSDDVLDSAFRALVEPGQRIALPDPTFAMVPLFAAVNGIHARPVPLTPDGDVDAGGLLATGADITYLCSPNNPTGRSLSPAAVHHIVEHARGAVILDEAYAEFADHSFVPLACAHEHVLVTRTLSKAFGMAGLRVGYGVGAPALVELVEKARGPYKVSAPAERAAVAALRHDRPWVHEHVQLVRQHRIRLADALNELPGIEAVPSDANFVLARLRPTATTTGLSAVMLTHRLRTRGVAVRPFSALTGLGDAIRITIGPSEMMDHCLSALRAEVACA